MNDTKKQHSQAPATQPTPTSRENSSARPWRVTEDLPVPRTGRQLMVFRRRRMLSQYDMAIYLGISRYRLCKLEQENAELPGRVDVDAWEVLNRYDKDCSNSPHWVIKFLHEDGFSFREIADASGIAISKVKAIDRGLKPTQAELDALLNVPPRPPIRMRGCRAQGRRRRR